MSAGHHLDAPRPDAIRPDPGRWHALAVLGLIQFMLVLDMTVVNVALPRIQQDLGFSGTGLAWVVNGYLLMAGGLLLLGGRLADLYGRRRLFLLGVGVFALASATCGAAGTPAVLVSGRFGQGIGEALAAPASLGLIAVLFRDPHERIKALGVWGGLTGLGGVSGAVISGALTDVTSWRWIFFINLPIALLALVMVPRLVSESRMVRAPRRIDLAGAVTATGGLVAVVDGLLEAASRPWGSWQVLLPLVTGVVLLAMMVSVEARSPAPLIPLRFFSNRTRVVANVITLFNTSAFIAYVYLLTLFEQQVLRYSPLEGGLSYLPLGFGIGAGIGLGTSLMPRIGVRALLSTGFLGAAVGLLLTSGVHVGVSYVGGVLPGMVVLAVSSGVIFPTITNAALHQVTRHDASLASGIQSAMQAVGGALGLACLVTLALRRSLGELRSGAAPGIAATHGFVFAFRVGAASLLLGGMLALVLLERVTAQPRNPAAELDSDSDSAPRQQAAV